MIKIRDKIVAYCIVGKQDTTLRITIPNDIVKYIKIKPGDIIKWILNVEGESSIKIDVIPEEEFDTKKQHDLFRY